MAGMGCDGQAVLLQRRARQQALRSGTDAPDPYPAEALRCRTEPMPNDAVLCGESLIFLAMGDKNAYKKNDN